MPRPVAIAPADARHHLHVLGATGAGNSTLLTNLVLGDVAAGRGVVVIDPKGDLADASGLHTPVLFSVPGPKREAAVLRVVVDARTPVATTNRMEYSDPAGDVWLKSHTARRQRLGSIATAAG